MADTQPVGGESTVVEAEVDTQKVVKIATQNVKVDGYRGIWYANQRSGDVYRFKYSGGLGTYCAKHRPFAIYSPTARKTFFCYGGAARNNNHRLVHMVSYFDHKTGMVPQPTLLLDKKTGDAHDNPVISLDYHGHLWIFSTSHGRGRPSFVHRSKEPFSIDAFERIDATYSKEGETLPLDNFSYLQVWPQRKGGFASFFTRYKAPADRTLFFMKSADGKQWSAWQRLAAFEKGHYQVSVSDGDHLGSAFNYHPNGKVHPIDDGRPNPKERPDGKGQVVGQGLNYRTNLYYVETLDGGLTWQNAAGETLQLPLTEVSNPALVRDFAAEEKNIYMKDIQFDEQGNPVILILASRGYQSGPINDPRDWLLAHWTDEQWTFSTIAQSDNNYDMGSLFLEKGQWRLVAPTEQGPQAYNTGGEVCMWTSADQGKTWKRGRQLTRNSPYNHTFVRRPIQAHPDFYAFWADGHGRQPSKSRLYFCNQQGDVFQLPALMDGPFAKPRKLTATGEQAAAIAP
ncbi:BNR-4 repeat-containing protein [Adhaeretor mobilis]|uniref:BNR-4 repeat-containing protein n=1 Tax=Adhaeretor mobilis TaxID=1930276 RepID=UPI001FE89C0D|nr:BNR-4 repeat-containing protein [Adhaeretor mobilis]